MVRISAHLLAAALLMGAVAAPTLSWAESKTESMKSSDKSKASATDEFEENRRAHMSKSKENNQKKGAE